MIGWIGFIGKVVEFVATKLIGKRIDLALDDKKRACKAFLNLYDSVIHLEQVTRVINSDLELIITGKKDRIYSFWLERMSPQIDSASTEFLNGIHELWQAIEVLDPNLVLLFSSIKRGKKTVCVIDI